MSYTDLEETEDVVIDFERDDNWRIIVNRVNEVGRGDNKDLLHAKRWYLYIGEKLLLFKVDIMWKFKVNS